jgi:hypothetical protein
MQVATIYANIGNMSDDESLNEAIADNYKKILERKVSEHFGERGWHAVVELYNAAGASRDPHLFFDAPEDEDEFMLALPELETEAHQEASELV